MKTQLRFLKLFLPIIALMAGIEGYFRLFDRQPIFENYTTAKFGIPTAFRKNQQVQQALGDFPYTDKIGR
jgi:hypothetical protein